MKNKYTPLRLLLYIHIEKRHRYVFNKLYHQDYKIKSKDKITLLYYKMLFKLFSDFRPYIKHWKYVLKRAYFQNRLNWVNYTVYLRLKKINTERYSGYFE